MIDLWTLKQHDFLPQKPLGMADIGCCSSPYLERRDVLNISVLQLNQGVDINLEACHLLVPFSKRQCSIIIWHTVLFVRVASSFDIISDIWSKIFKFLRMCTHYKHLDVFAVNRSTLCMNYLEHSVTQ